LDANWMQVLCLRYDICNCQTILVKYLFDIITEGHTNYTTIQLIETVGTVCMPTLFYHDIEEFI
jgi:hypothetical protein